MSAPALPRPRPRVLRGLISLLLLMVTVLGVPLALVALGGNPLPATVSWDDVRHALLTPDDGTILIGLITVLGWAAWLVFTVSVISELIGLVSRQRIRISLPGLAGPQRLAAGLLLSVIALAAAPQLVPAPPSPTVAAIPTRPPAPEPVVSPIEAAPSIPQIAPVMAAQTGTPSHAHRHVVEPGDDLWSLAEEFYGHGQDWRRIASANPDLLTGGPDRLQVGWTLIIPDLDAALTRIPGEQPVTVRRGDTLSAIAERELGSSSRWAEIYRANRAQLSDPDELTPGQQLILPKSASAVPERRQPADPVALDPGERPVERASEPELGPPRTTATPTPQPTTPAQSTSPTIDAAPSTGSDAASALDVALPLAAVGGLLAAGLVQGLAWRRQVQLQARPIGRRLPQPPAATQPIAVALSRRQRPLSLRTLDRAMRAIAAHCRTTKTPPPPLELAIVADDQIELVMSEAVDNAPIGFRVRGRSWILSQADAGFLSSVPGLAESPRPWPALVTLGRDDQDRQVLADLEAFRRLTLEPSAELDAAAVLAAMAVELSFSPWADEMILTLVGSVDRLPEALGKHNVSRADDLDALLSRIEQRAVMQREQHPHPILGGHRIDPDLADPWAPEILLINAPLTDEQERRLTAVLDDEPRVTMASVVVGPSAGAAWTLRADPDSSPGLARLLPAGLSLTPQLLEAPAMDAVLDLVQTSGSEHTTPAPWWWNEAETPDNVTHLSRRFSEGGTAEAEGESIMAATAVSNGSVDHPTMQLLGPLDLLGAAGTEPVRAAKQCLEYCAWLLQNPGTTAQAMMAGLAVAEGTRRSNMSRLRTWLGSSPAGEAYLPDAYTGRIVLHPDVSSDWQLLQILTAVGVNRASDESLRAALGLVRGAPLADAAPGQWHWAEELRTDMISYIRDIGAELAERAVLAGDVDLARWAAARALVAAPGDELLLTTRIRTEHLAGNGPETERLARQLAAQARMLDVDLNPETVTVLQQVMEGRVRARLA